MIDALEEMLRKIRPYELEAGSADAAFDRAIDVLMDGIEAHGVRGAARGFARAVDIMDAVAYDRSNPRPTTQVFCELGSRLTAIVSTGQTSLSGAPSRRG